MIGYAVGMFEGWSEYFFMIGSSAAALIGLMFVVVTLTAGRDRRELEGGKRLYTSPIVWHLGVVLVLSGAAIAPGMGPRLFGASSGALAMLGFALGVRNTAGISRTGLSAGENLLFDMSWYGIIPAAVYVALGAAAAAVFTGQSWGPPAIAAALMALLLVSIHAEWDLVTFLAPMAPQPGHRSKADTED
jgi:hypothetical protein